MEEQNDQSYNSPEIKHWPHSTKVSRGKWFWVAVVLGIGLIAFGIAAYKGIKHNNELTGKDFKGQIFNSGNIWPEPDAKYITALPVDLAQIQSISKYRSCAGHIRDGYNFNKELELDRSMKHYLLPVPEFQSTNDKVKLFAPFDGTIFKLDWEKDKKDTTRKNNGNGIHLSTSVDPNVDFGIGHMYFTKDFKVGDKVKAGELLGYAAVDCGVGLPGCDFDLDLSTPGGTSAYEGREILGFIFDHMTDSVLAEFAKYGITSENAKFTKEYRDANPCGYNSDSEGQQKSKEEAVKDTDGRHNENWIQLKR